MSAHLSLRHARRNKCRGRSGCWFHCPPTGRQNNSKQTTEKKTCRAFTEHQNDDFFFQGLWRGLTHGNGEIGAHQATGRQSAGEVEFSKRCCNRLAPSWGLWTRAREEMPRHSARRGLHQDGLGRSHNLPLWGNEPIPTSSKMLHRNRPTTAMWSFGCTMHTCRSLELG